MTVVGEIAVIRGPVSRVRGSSQSKIDRRAFRCRVLRRRTGPSVFIAHLRKGTCCRGDLIPYAEVNCSSGALVEGKLTDCPNGGPPTPRDRLRATSGQQF